MGTYFLNPELAYQEALQQKRTGLYNDLQICYYHGEPLDRNLPNLINLPLEHINDVLPAFLGKINTFLNDVYHRDIGTLESYAQAQIDMKNRGTNLAFSPIRGDYNGTNG